MTSEIKLRMKLLVSGIAFYGITVWLTYILIIPEMVKFAMFLAVYFVSGFDVFKKISQNLMDGKVLDEHLLMVLATAGAFGVNRYIEAIAVIILFQIAMIFESYSVDRAKRMIAEKIDIRPEYATRKLRGKEVKIDPAELKVQNIIVIKPGERIPVDAIVTKGRTNLDTKAITGEAMPEEVGPGDMIYSGTINLSGAIEARVKRLYKDSMVSRIMEQVERAQKQKAFSENRMKQFSATYTIAMVILAMVIMFVPPMTFAYGDFDTWVYRGLIVLIAACPGGLIISIPVAFLGGIAAAASRGILVKGGNYLEEISQADTFVFDKTGTLTEGTFKVKKMVAIGVSEEYLLSMAAHVESYSNHPIGQSIVRSYEKEYKKELEKSKVKRVKELPGYGITASYDGQKVRIGNLRFMREQKIEVDIIKGKGTVIYVAIDKKYAGYIILGDTIKENAKRTLQVLQEKYNAVLVMMTGDNEASGQEVAKALQMDYAYTGLLPEDKLEQMEEFLKTQDSMEKVICVGDGINDALVLARADVGIAMGALGSAAAIEAADVVLMEDELPHIIDVMEIAKETMRVVNQNIVYAVLLKGFILLLAAMGFVSMWTTIVIDASVMILAILNAVWIIKYPV